MDKKTPFTLPIQPGSWLGVFGGGQLGRMFVQAAVRHGYHIHVFVDKMGGPATEIAERITIADYRDLDKVGKFAKLVDAATVEFENIPGDSLEYASRFTRVAPGANVLRVLQDRRSEKTFLRDAGLCVTPFALVESFSQFLDALQSIGKLGVLKSATGGYDGHGQARIQERMSPVELREAYESLGGEECPMIYEAFISFKQEVSVVAARNDRGEFYAYPPFENRHAEHILDTTIFPAQLSPEVIEKARETARLVGDALDIVGVYCVEYFVTEEGGLYLSEVAPRPHNSGHLTIDLLGPSQYDLQVRTLCGLPLPGEDEVLDKQSGVMVNLLGKLWIEQCQDGSIDVELADLADKEAGASLMESTLGNGMGPEACGVVGDDGVPMGKVPFDVSEILAIPGVSLHLYGKKKLRPGRKMGHLTWVGKEGDDKEEKVRSLNRLRSRIVRKTKE